MKFAVTKAYNQTPNPNKIVVNDVVKKTGDRLCVDHFCVASRRFRCDKASSTSWLNTIVGALGYFDNLILMVGTVFAETFNQPSNGRFFSRVLRDSTPRFVGPSVHRSVRRSVTLYFFWVFVVFGLTAPAQTTK